MLLQRKDNIMDVPVGSFRGLELSLHRQYGGVYLAARGVRTYTTDMADSEIGNISRLESFLNSLRALLTEQETQRGNMEVQLEAAKIQVSHPFAYEKELNEHSLRLMELNTKLEFQELADKDAVLEDEQDNGEPMSAMQPEPAIVRG